MKRIILFIPLILAFIASISYAQDSEGLSFGIRAGVNFQNINGKDAEKNTLENSLTPGFHVGMNVEIPLAPEFYFQPGLLFSTKGSKKKETILSATFTHQATLSYLELPLNFVYKPLLGTGHLILGFGPYLGYAISGKSKYELAGIQVEDNMTFQSTVQTSDPYNLQNFKAFDAGANILFGYELTNNLSFQLNAQYGLVKINSEDGSVSNDPSIAKNTGFGVSAGYRF
ncbi:PorT family protein [bacterium]|nr:PorT family protein [bacterium]